MKPEFIVLLLFLYINSVPIKNMYDMHVMGLIIEIPAGGSLESRALGTVVPTMRSTSGSPLIPPRDAHYSHRGVPLPHPLPCVLAQSPDGFMTDMRTLTKPENNPKGTSETRCMHKAHIL